MRKGSFLVILFLFLLKYLYIDIFFRLYYIQGKIAYSQHKSRSVMVKTKKGSDFLPITIENYLCDLYLNPTSFDTWLSLAICYSELAYELLCWSSDEIALSFTVIRQYQIVSNRFIFFANLTTLSRKHSIVSPKHTTTIVNSSCTNPYPKPKVVYVTAIQNQKLRNYCTQISGILSTVSPRNR